MAVADPSVFHLSITRMDAQARTELAAALAASQVGVAVGRHGQDMSARAMSVAISGRVMCVEQSVENISAVIAGAAP